MRKRIARLLDRCEAKGKYLAKHWQCGESALSVVVKPWKNEELKSAEEALPTLKESHLEEVSRSYEGKTGVGSDGSHPEVPLGLTRENDR